MKNILQLSILFSLLTFSLSSIAEQSADAVPAVKSQLAEQRLLTNITKVNNTVIAVGARGHILLSTDGTNWEQANVPVNVLLTSISFSSELVGYAVGHDATILKTEDGGKNWTLLNYQPELDRPFLSVSTNKDKVVVVGAYGMYYESQDDGVTWENVFQDELLIEDDRLYLQDIKEFEPENYEKERQYLLPHFNQILITDDTWYMAGEAGFLAQSENQGQDWQRIDMEYYGSFFAVEEYEGKLIVAGLRGNMFIQDAVSSAQFDWQGQVLPGKATLNDILILNDKIFLFGNSGNMYFTQSGESVSHHLFEDGKAVMAGEVLGDKLVLATESGVKTLLISELK